MAHLNVRQKMKHLVLFLLLVSCAGCFRFGDDVELSGVQFSDAYLKKITEVTGIRFPEGSTGLEYYYLGSGIDPALAARIEIPKAKKDEFLANDIFRNGHDERPHIEIGKGKDWWRPDGMTARIDRKLSLPNARFLECSLGDEDGRTVVYLSWITT